MTANPRHLALRNRAFRWLRGWGIPARVAARLTGLTYVDVRRRFTNQQVAAVLREVSLSYAGADFNWKGRRVGSVSEVLREAAGLIERHVDQA